MASKSTLLGAAGEHYVMCELLRRGYIAALAPQGVPNSDIVVTDIEGQRLCSIQVKTRRDIGSDGGWHMKAKHENIIGDRVFYCFLDFGKEEKSIPQIFIVPSTIVAKALKEAYQHWLNKPGKNGQAHKDGNFRRFLPDYSKIFEDKNSYPAGWLEKYRNAWQLLGLTATNPTDDQEDK